MRALLLGAGGMLAHDLRTEAPDSVDLVARTRAELDVTDTQAVRRALAASRPDVVLNTAAFTQVDRAEQDQARAFAVNAEAVGALGRAAVAGGTVVVHFSTDYIFDGATNLPYREDDAARPLGLYGKSKHQGELELHNSGAPYLIVRSQWLYGLHGRSFPRTMWERAAARAPSRVVNDQVGRPTYTVDLARATWGLIGSGARGVVHVANASSGSWYDVARLVYRRAGVEELVQACTTAEYPTPARRPHWSVLDTTRMEGILGAPLPPWEEALERFLTELTILAARA